MAEYRPIGVIALEAVEDVTGVPVWQIRGSRGADEILDARCMVVWILDQCTSLSRRRIGSIVNRHDHSTVRNALNRARRRLKEDATFAERARDALTKVSRHRRRQGFPKRMGPYSPAEKAAATFLKGIGRSDGEIAWILGRELANVSRILNLRNEWPPKDLGPLSHDRDENNALINELFVHVHGNRRFE